jgi:class 3 adenylate cyclase
MNESAARELAARSGTDEAYVRDLERLGFLDPNLTAVSPGSVRVVRMIRSLQDAGLSLDEMASAVHGGMLSFSFLDMPVFDRFAGLSGSTFRSLSEETGIPLELLTVVREAIGFAQPAPDDLLRDDELLIVPAIREHVKRGLRPAAIERWLRVYGDSTRRMAETEADWWRTEVEQPLIDAGLGQGVVLDTAAEWGATTAPLVEQALLAMYHAQEEHAWLGNIVGNVEHALEAAGIRANPAVAPAICFLDLSGYTRLTEERGDVVAAERAANLAHLVARLSRHRGGKAVKWLGDGVMLYFRDARPSVAAALEMLDRVVDAGVARAHIGVHAGPVVFQEGDYFGRTVNVAARITDYARPGEVLASEDAVNLSNDDALRFTEIGPVDLKGVAAPVQLYSVARASRP